MSVRTEALREVRACSLTADGHWERLGGIIRSTIGNTTCFEVMPDGEHFLMVRADPEAIPTRLRVIFNWFEELKAKVPLRQVDSGWWIVDSG
jgi:hypothetical protein